MSRDDWYQRTTWTEEDRTAFYARLSRSKSVFNKSQYARIQALTLASHGEHQAALELLSLVLREFPDESQVALAYQQQAECHVALGNSAEAIASYRKSFPAEKNYPTFRTNAWLDYPWYVVTLGREELYAEVLEIIVEHERERELVFPVEVYMWAGAKAVLAQAFGQEAQAQSFAQKAIEASQQESSGLRHHPEVGLVSDVGTQMHERIVALADA